jgi:hypothetical protein
MFVVIRNGNSMLSALTQTSVIIVSTMVVVHGLAQEVALQAWQLGFETLVGQSELGLGFGVAGRSTVGG